MSFGEQDDELFTIDLSELLNNKEKILRHHFVPQIIPVMTNYDLNAGFVFQLAVVPFAYDVSVGNVYDALQPNEYQLCDHLEIDPKTISGEEQVAFNSKDYKRVRNVIDGNFF
jgi:hypothetical protein